MVFDDLRGRRFGDLVVVERVDDYVSPAGHHHSRYLCRYDNGIEKVMRRNVIIKSGNAKRRSKEDDLIGVTVGNLTVIGRVEDYIAPSGRHHRQYLCRCKDGQEKILRRMEIAQKIFALQQRPRQKSKSSQDLTGLRFGRWSVIGPVSDDWWHCKCDCGVERDVRGSGLRSGGTMSCGCLQKEIVTDKIKEDRLWERQAQYQGTSITKISHTGARTGSSTGERGVTYDRKYGKFTAYICVKSQYIYLGYYRDLSDAKAIRKIAEQILFVPLINEYNSANSSAYTLENDGFLDWYAAEFPEKVKILTEKAEKKIHDWRVKNNET